MVSEEFRIKKYPRTPHLSGSRLQTGDEDLSQIPFDNILGKHIVIEEKVDGANVAISFDDQGNILLQSRGHYLNGGARERHYEQFKTWCNIHRYEFYDVLGSQYIMYGEWLLPKHKVYYDNLPHYFMEFDIYDRKREVFLSTDERKIFTSLLPFVYSVPVLGEGIFKNKEEILKYLGNSLYITEHHFEVLKEQCEKANANYDDVIRETDPTTLMEGLYIKVEEEGIVKDRMKYVSHSYVQTSENDESNWLSKPIVANVAKNSLF